jgi:hypothetical protein
LLICLQLPQRAMARSERRGYRLAMDTATLTRFRAYLNANFTSVKDVTLALDDNTVISGLITRIDPDLEFVVVEQTDLVPHEPHPTLITTDRILRATVTPYEGSQTTY